MPNTPTSPSCKYSPSLTDASLPSFIANLHTHTLTPFFHSWLLPNRVGLFTEIVRKDLKEVRKDELNRGLKNSENWKSALMHNSVFQMM